MANEKLNYQVILKEITKYYPVGIDDEEPEYPGTTLLKNLCHGKTMTKEYNAWKEFINELKEREENVLRSSASSAPYDPCHSGILLLLKQKMGDTVYTREIRFHVSILAPFYTIYGVDKIILKQPGEDHLSFDPIIFVSPLQVYEKWFPAIRGRIETLFDGYQFLSFAHLRTRVKSLKLPGARIRGQDASVFQALFMPDDITTLQIKGDPLYE